MEEGREGWREGEKMEGLKRRDGGMWRGGKQESTMKAGIKSNHRCTYTCTGAQVYI